MGMKDGIPVATGYFAVALALGISAGEAGLTALQGFFMSLGMHASAGEYAAVLLIASGAGIAELIITTVVVNLRYFLMGCSMSMRLREIPFHHRFLLAACMTDEIFALSVRYPSPYSPYYSYGAMAIAALGWESGTVVGILVGDVLPPDLQSALAVALFGMFLAIVIPRTRGSKFMTGLLLISMLSSALFTYAPYLSRLSEGFRVIILTVLISAVAAYLRPMEEATEETAKEGRS